MNRGEARRKLTQPGGTVPHHYEYNNLRSWGVFARRPRANRQFKKHKYINFGVHPQRGWASVYQRENDIVMTRKHANMTGFLPFPRGFLKNSVCDGKRRGQGIRKTRQKDGVIPSMEG